jgi:predicted deacylase
MEIKIRRIRLTNSEIVEIGEGKPVVGIIGLLHGDEICGRIVLDELIASKIKPKGKLKIIYANLEAEKQNKRYIESNLNRSFNNQQNTLEGKTAHELSSHLADCNYVLDIHSTSYPTEPFVISTADNKEFDKLASFTGLKKYVIIVDKMANGSSLIDEVFRRGGKGISFESGTHNDNSSVIVARAVVNNFLINLGILEGKGVIKTPEKFYGKDIKRVPSKTFKAYSTIKNFELLKAGTPYGRDETKEYLLDKDGYPFLFSDKLVDGIVFLVADKVKPEKKK